MIKGIGVSQGIAVGRALVHMEESIKPAHRAITENMIDQEVARLDAALTKSIAQIEKIAAKVLRDIGQDKAQVFEAHKMLLEDPVLKDSVVAKIKQHSIGAEVAAVSALEELKAVFEAMENEYMRERAADIADISKRLISNIMGKEIVDLTSLTEDVLIIARDLTPSDTASMDKRYVKGFATEIGGRTSHTAIIARTLEIPAVVGCGQTLAEIHNGDMVILDGISGDIFVNPPTELIAEYHKKAAEFLARKEKLQQLQALPAVTVDGHHVELAGNIGKPEDTAPILANGGDAVGLFRTEFLYMNKDRFPTEEEQFNAYKGAALGMKGKAVIVRTLDIGGDKHLSYLDLSGEMNPFLGYRAIRICLDKVDLFKTQLRAILRGSAFGKLRVMFPMISGLEEIRRAKAILAECKSELREQKLPFDEDIEVGIMVEIPSAAVMADVLAKEVDFFSIGTNDLCQYTLAVDRMNEKISYLYDPLNPAVLRLIKNVIDAGHKEKIMVGVCGEMASSIENAVILLGMGLDEFSMSASAIPYVKEMIRNITWEQAKKIMAKAMELESGSAIRAYVHEELAAL